MDALASSQDPRNVIHWVEHSPNAKLLSELAATGESIRHELLDSLPPSRHESYVRQILVHTGVLSARLDDIERIPVWLDTKLADRPAEHASLLRPYVHWQLLRRARRRAAQRRHPASAEKYLRRRVTKALSLLGWLDTQHVSLGDMTQRDLDRWLTSSSHSHNEVRYFLSWAARHGLAPKLTVPLVPRGDPANLLDEDERLALLRRCMTDETMPLDTRTAAALVLWFGIPLSRVRNLTTEQVESRGDKTFLIIGRKPLLLPPRLARMIGRLTEERLRTAPLSNGPVGQRWLFPGLVPGRPITEDGFTRRFRQHGINALESRNAALVALAADLPSAVLADVLGLHPETALRWTRLAKRDWAAYIAERADDRSRNERGPSRDSPQQLGQQGGGRS